MQTGDLIAFAGRRWTSKVINLGTFGIPGWSPSHVGIIGEYRGEHLLFESTTLSTLPCLIQGKPFKGVQACTLEDRVATYNGRIWRYPLARKLFDDERERLNAFLVHHVGVPYDRRGAIRSGGRLWANLWSAFENECLSQIFCSELLAAAYRDIGVLHSTNASRWNPRRLIIRLRRERMLLSATRLK